MIATTIEEAVIEFFCEDDQESLYIIAIRRNNKEIKKKIYIYIIIIIIMITIRTKRKKKGGKNKFLL